MQKQRCTFLGTGNAVLHPDRNGPGFLLEWSGLKLQLDMGYGTSRELLRHKLSYQDIDLYVISHWHIDHISDLLPTLFLANIPNFNPDKPVEILAPKGFQEIFNNLKASFGKWIESSRCKIIIHEISAGESFQLKSLTIKAYPAKHIPGALSYRIYDREKTFAYSGDTGDQETLSEVFQDCQFGILECSFPPNIKFSNHMNLLEVLTRFSAETSLQIGLVHLYSTAIAEELQQTIEKHNIKHIFIAEQGSTIPF